MASSATPNKLDQQCKEHYLMKIAKTIPQWQNIAPFLELTDVEEAEIKASYPDSLFRQSLAMLKKWKEKQGHKATYKRLVEVFEDAENIVLVEEVYKILKEESSSSTSDSEEELNLGSAKRPRWCLTRYANYLKGRYCSTTPPVLSLQWPPPPTHTVFNLALIQKERIEYGPNEELVRLLQRGQVDEAAEVHTEFELSNLLMLDSEARKVILIEGAPGSGKSTLSWHICQQWEKGMLFNEYEVVLFVQLRDPKVQSATSLSDIFSVPGEDGSEQTLAPLITKHGRWGKGVLLVLDGWDELQTDCSAYSLLLQLIQIPDFLNMHHSSVIITSRPVSSGVLQ